MRGPSRPLLGGLTVVRPATAEDANLLVAWHGDPEIARYWDHKTFTREEILARLARPHVAAFIVEAEERPVGYLQAWFDSESEGAGLDMFLIPSMRGRGLGPDAARTLARSLCSAGQMLLSVDPNLWNEAAIRAWGKAGFRPVEEREPDKEHTGRWLLMTFDAASAM